MKLRSHYKVVAVAATVAIGAVPSAALSAQAALPSTPGWTLAWSDDFSGAAGTGVNTANWLYDTGTNPGGACNETTGLGGSTTCPGATCQSAFHDYRIEWDRSGASEQLRWSVDGVIYHTVNQSDVDATTWANATGHGFFIILNVAMGGSWPGRPGGLTKSGIPMLVDYVSVNKSI
ncbi:MAG: family 16 glycosylhydrolase [Ramlibacter sp.]|nr:family 16 glycosylhydrolase [Cryobacterium sp.]